MIIRCDYVCLWTPGPVLAGGKDTVARGREVRCRASKRWMNRTRKQFSALKNGARVSRRLKVVNPANLTKLLCHGTLSHVSSDSFLIAVQMPTRPCNPLRCPFNPRKNITEIADIRPSETKLWAQLGHIIPVKDDMANLLANSCLFIYSADTAQN